MLNKVRCADGLWRTLDGHEIYHHKKAAGTLCQAALRAELTRRLGVAFDEPNQHGQAEVAGIPDDLIRLWSKRTTAIDADAAQAIERFEDELGRPLTAAERARVTKTSVLKTRPAKTHADPGLLQHRWRSEAEAYGWTGARLRDAVAHAASGASGRAATPQHHGGAMSAMERALSPLGHSRVVREALSAVGARAAVFSRADLAAELAAHLPTRAASAARVREQVESLTAQAATPDKDASTPQPTATPRSTPCTPAGTTPYGEDTTR